MVRDVLNLSNSTWGLGVRETSTPPCRDAGAPGRSEQEVRVGTRWVMRGITEWNAEGLGDERSASPSVSIKEEDLGTGAIGATRSNGRVQARFLLKEEVVYS